MTSYVDQAPARDELTRELRELARDEHIALRMPAADPWLAEIRGRSARVRRLLAAHVEHEQEGTT